MSKKQNICIILSGIFLCILCMNITGSVFLNRILDTFNDSFRILLSNFVYKDLLSILNAFGLIQGKNPHEVYNIQNIIFRMFEGIKDFNDWFIGTSTFPDILTKEIFISFLGLIKDITLIVSSIFALIYTKIKFEKGFIKKFISIIFYIIIALLCAKIFLFLLEITTSFNSSLYWISLLKRGPQRINFPIFLKDIFDDIYLTSKFIKSILNFLIIPLLLLNSCILVINSSFKKSFKVTLVFILLFLVPIILIIQLVVFYRSLLDLWFIFINPAYISQNEFLMSICTSKITDYFIRIYGISYFERTNLPFSKIILIYLPSLIYLIPDIISGILFGCSYGSIIYMFIYNLKNNKSKAVTSIYIILLIAPIVINLLTTGSQFARMIAGIIFYNI